MECILSVRFVFLLITIACDILQFVHKLSSQTHLYKGMNICKYLHKSLEEKMKCLPFIRVQQTKRLNVIWNFE